MLRKVLTELILIRKELQTICSSLESKQVVFNTDGISVIHQCDDAVATLTDELQKEIKKMNY